MDHALAIKRLKYVTSYWFAKFLHDELPPVDWLPHIDVAHELKDAHREIKQIQPDHWLFTGSVRRYLRDRMVSVTAKNAKFFYSLLQAKRACDPVPDTFVQGALEKHRKVIGTASSGLTIALHDEIEHKVDQILSGWTPFEDRQCEPSHSASFEVSRCDGGQHRALIDQLDGPVVPDDLVGMVEVRPGVVEERRGWLAPNRADLLYSAYVHENGRDCISLRETKWMAVAVPSGDAPHVSWNICYVPAEGEEFLSLPAIDGAGQMTCKVATVLEPLKVRTVTKGRAQAYQAVHGVQKWMHGNLRRTDVFRLIGQTVDENVIKELFEKRLPGEKFISGDYSAATDNLKIDVTKTLFERILFRLANDLEYSDEALQLVTLCRKVLYEHIVSYPKDSGLEDVKQATGQLMGSPLSFPLLCLANCICCWICLFPDKKFEELPMLVNGDDIAFACSDERYAKWSDSLKDFGFVKSVGKNYCHQRFMIINSELFDSKYKETGRCHLPYFASGLLLGRSKVCKNEDGLEAPPVVVSLELCLRGSDNPNRTISRFMAYNHEKVEKVTGRKTSLFLPITRGGLGLKPYGVHYHVSLWQRRYAAYLSKRGVLRTSHFVREADEPGQWHPTYRILDTDLKPDMTDYEILPGLIEDGIDVSESTWLPGLTEQSRRLFLTGIDNRTREHQLSLAGHGPAGWKLMDTEGRTVWKTSLSGAANRAILREKPLSGELLDELPYRYTDYRPVGLR